MTDVAYEYAFQVLESPVEQVQRLPFFGLARVATARLSVPENLVDSGKVDREVAPVV